MLSMGNQVLPFSGYKRLFAICSLEMVGVISCEKLDLLLFYSSVVFFLTWKLNLLNVWFTSICLTGMGQRLAFVLFATFRVVTF